MDIPKKKKRQIRDQMHCLRHVDIFKRMILNEITRASESIPIGGNLRKNGERKWENVVKENKILLRYI